MRQDVTAPSPASLHVGAEATAARWQALWEHRPALLKVAERRCPSPADAPDVVQEAVMRAAAKPDLRLDEAGAWMTRVVVNLCADLHRQPRHADLASAPEVPSPRPECCSPEQHLAVRGDVAVVLRRFPTLPPRQREAVRLRASDLTVGEVAERMGLPYKTVESLLSRARKHLRVGLVVAGTAAAARRLLQLGTPSSSTVTAAAAVVVAVGAGAGAVVSVPGGAPGPGAPGRTATALLVVDPPARAHPARPPSGGSPSAGVAPRVAGAGPAEVGPPTVGRVADGPVRPAVGIAVAPTGVVAAPARAPRAPSAPVVVATHPQREVPALDA